LQLIDLSSVAWGHLFELRKDEDSIRKLKNLKRYLYKNFEGKPQSYIRDTLLEDIEKYNDVIKSWKLKTKEATLECIFSSSTAPAITTVAIAVAFGVPPITAGAAAVAAGMANALIDLGRVTLGISQKKWELLKFQNESPVTYLIEATKLPGAKTK